MMYRQLLPGVILALHFWTPSPAEELVLLVSSEPDHPHATHMYAFECDLLASCLNQHEGVKAEHVRGWPPRSTQLAAAKTVVFYSNPAGSVLLQDAYRDAFDQRIKAGVGFVAIHWGTGVGYDKISEPAVHRELFKRWLGGWFRRPPCGIAITRTDLLVPNEQHPICNGWQPWKIHDEFYLDPVLHPRSEPLLKVAVNEKEHTVGWTLRREDGGRSVGITLGHFHHNFARDDFRRLLVNAILWSAQVDVPPDGAIVEVKAEDLKLPAP